MQHGKLVLSPGDMFYYSENYATGVLLRKTRMGWEYSLRSPNRKNLTYHMIKVALAEESMFVDGVATGRLAYFPKKG